MPTYTGAELADHARNVYLNRPGITDTAFLPIINAVYETFQQTCIQNSVPIFKKDFDFITVSAGATSIEPGGGVGQLPDDFVEPIELSERAVGGIDTDYVPMKERTILPRATAGNTLMYWVWDEENIKLIGCTTAREVQIYGYKSLPLLSDMKDQIRVSFSKDYLACAAAAQAALSISHNPTLARELEGKATTKLNLLLNKYIRKNQSLPTRRRAFRRPSERGRTTLIIPQ